jgi:peptide chain release factor 1
VTGLGAKQLFANESGGHRWQRVPPNEKRGRVHTSTVTVAVTDPDVVQGPSLNHQDVDITTTRGSGPGGQHRNKVESCIVATHRPTGLQVRIDNERSQHQNRAMAYRVLAARLYQAERERLDTTKNADRRQQVGTGMRGDKVRTYRTQDDQVTDHRTGVKTRLSRWYNGDW